MTFADRSFWVALLDRRDEHNPPAAELWATHAGQGVITTNHVRVRDLDGAPPPGAPPRQAFLDALAFDGDFSAAGFVELRR